MAMTVDLNVRTMWHSIHHLSFPISKGKVAGNSTERGRKTHLVNRWLRDWCYRLNFGFFDHGEAYTAPGLLVTGRSQLSQRRKRILGHELAGLIERALN